jgi:hypothetical protein
MDLTTLLYDQIDPDKIWDWWNELTPVQQYQFAPMLEEQLQEAAGKYCEKVDVWELYYELTHDYRKLLDELEYSFDWNIDLHNDSEAYDDFNDNRSEIVFDLAQLHVDWFLNISRFIPHMDSDELTNMLMAYFESFPIWKK